MRYTSPKPKNTVADMRDELKQYLSRELHKPAVEILHSRVPKPYYARVKSKALELKTTPSQLYRFLAAKGAEQFGIDLLSVM